MTEEKLKSVKEAKRKLFVELLECRDIQLTDNEVDIMYSLSKDRDIQDILKKLRSWENDKFIYVLSG
jgi:succinate dehydrogenase flavin-adding protein (antitoxin of CptAB toxin-antitoxin module)